jgi:hypothetical protein
MPSQPLCALSESALPQNALPRMITSSTSHFSLLTRHFFPNNQSLFTLCVIIFNQSICGLGAFTVDWKGEPLIKLIVEEDAFAAAVRSRRERATS